MSEKTNLSVGILAGNRSSGINQAKAKAGNRYVVRKLAEELSSIGEVMISASAKNDYEDLAERVFQDCSLLEGLYNVISNAETDLVFVCGADMPMVTGELVRYMAGYISSDYDCYCLTDEKHIQPLCAIYSKAVLPFIEKALENGDFKLIHLLRHVRTKFIDLSFTTFDKKVIRNNNIRKPAKTQKPQMVFCVSGPKNTGKTGLIIRLINEFIREGYSVGTIKHDGHEYDMDHEGTDSFRFSQAGAKVSAIFSGGRFSVNCNGPAGPEEMLAFCRGLDVVIFEGLKNSPYPKIEMARPGSPLMADPATVILIASDTAKDKKSPYSEKIPVLDRDDTEGIFSMIKKYFDLEQL